MANAKHILQNVLSWTDGKQLLFDVYEYEYLADTWPERLGIEDIALLQAAGKEYSVFEAWRVCLTKAAEGGELTTKQEECYLARDRGRRESFLIPPCHMHRMNNVLLSKSELIKRATASAADFADYLRSEGERSSKLITEWFDAFDIERPTDEQQAETLGNAGGGSHAKGDTKAYELYKNSLDALVNSGIDLKPLKIETIFNQVKLTDKKLWSIAYTTFQRDVWPVYSRENNLGKQRGRPRN